MGEISPIFCMSSLEDQLLEILLSQTQFATGSCSKGVPVGGSAPIKLDAAIPGVPSTVRAFACTPITPGSNISLMRLFPSHNGFDWAAWGVVSEDKIRDTRVVISKVPAQQGRKKEEITFELMIAFTGKRSE